MIFNIPIDFFLFAAILILVALYHKHVFKTATIGLLVVSLYKIFFSPFKTGPGLDGFILHLSHEWVIVTNLLLLLVGFALLSDHFERSHVTEKISTYLPSGAMGAFSLLLIVFILSGFLDNIAAAIIGATIASDLYKKKVHMGYLAAIVASANAGGAGSVLGDTTTTMMWLGGVPPLDVLHGYIGAIGAFVVLAFFASRKQNSYQKLIRSTAHHKIDGWRLGIVAFILVLAVSTNIYVNMNLKEYADFFPFLGVSVWVAILVALPIRAPHWSLVPNAFKGSLFLLALVLTASMMPVEKLPTASPFSTFGLGFLSSIFDNIPLTAIALKQDNYDWGVLAYAVGYGGSMIWFGSSAGVAVSNIFPEAKSVGKWIKEGWFVALAYVVGYAVMMLIWGWDPDPLHTFK